jgi:hypothetical protein
MFGGRMKKKNTISTMKKHFFKHLVLIGVIASLFSFAPKHTASESVRTAKENYQTLTVDYSSIALSSDGWALQVNTTLESSTKQVTLTFICDIHEPNGTVLSNVNFRFFAIPEEGYNYTLKDWEYVKFIPVAQSGYPAGSYSANVHSVGASVYVPF